jgi:hypothetical protein
LAFGKINGSIPQSIPIVPSLIYPFSNIICHPGVPEKSFVIHKIIIKIKTIPTEISLHLKKPSNRFYKKINILSTVVFQDHCIV